MLCSIIIVCKDNLPDVEFTLKSIIDDKFLIDHSECIIVDDSSDDKISSYNVSLNINNLTYCRKT